MAVHCCCSPCIPHSHANPTPNPMLYSPVGHIVSLVLGGAITNHQHTMVQRRAALSLKHAAGIELEGALVSLDGNAHRLVGHGLHSVCKGSVSARAFLAMLAYGAASAA